MFKLKNLVLACSLSLLGFSAQAAEPLKQAGKETLYQRVLTTPDCRLVQNAGDANGTEIPAFSRYYVYERKNVNGAEWLSVGVDTLGKTAGWVNNQCAVPWNIQMTLTFTNPAGTGRDSLLFFKDQQALETVINSTKKVSDVEAIRRRLAASQSSPEIVAQEPETFIDFQKNFYLLPILQGTEIMNNDGFYERILEVASVSKDQQAVKKAESADIDKAMADYNAAIVFVIDASISMDPYINRTREAVKKIYDKIEQEGLQDKVKFGLVAFRSNTKAVPGLEFTSKMYVNPNNVKDGKDFLEKVKELKQAKVSSKEFSEDAYAGVDQALNDIDWDKFGGRYMVLVTDAGAIDGDNPLSTTQLNAQQLRLEAEHKGISLSVLHLKTPAGKKNHEIAESQYQELTRSNITNGILYYPVKAGDVQEFGYTTELLSNSLALQVKEGLKKETDKAVEEAAQQAKSKIELDAEMVGRAMKLAYLGRVQGQAAPSVFKAWISDRDFTKPDVPTSEVRVLLTKSQLNDLAEVVKKIADAGNTGLLAPDEMFKQLRSVAAAMGQDPSKIKDGSSTKIAEMGLLGEYLDGIPYKSQITGIDEDAWKAMSVQQQEKFVRDLNRKLAHYKRFNEDVNRWIALADGADPKDNVYPVPLEALP